MTSKSKTLEGPRSRPRVTPRARVRKSAVVIAGMHRSGTSVVARTLSLLGCALPRTLVESDRYNERGYWESQAVLNLNDEILASAGSSWDDWEPVNPAWFHSPVAAEFRDRARDVLSSEFGTAPLFVLKDPRICRLLPFWTDALQAFGATPLIVCPLRNPLEVAASLQARDLMDPSIGHLLWLRHLLDAEAASRGHKRAFVRYDDLVECWQEAADRLSASLEFAWPRRQSRTADLKMQEFLEQSLRHQVRKDASVLKKSSLSPWIRSTFDIIDRWTRNDVRDTDVVDLERIRSDFDSAAIAFRRPVAVGREAAHASRSWKAIASELRTTLERRELGEDVNGRHSTFAALELAHAVQLKELYEGFSATARQAKRVIAELDTGRHELVTRLRDSQQHTSRLKVEVVLLRQLVDQKEDQVRQHERQALSTRQLAARELGRIVNTFMERASQAYFFGRLQQRRHLGLLGKAGLVDPEWYLRRYPDVADAGLDPLRHYAEFGAREGREPNGLLAGTNGTSEPHSHEQDVAKVPVTAHHDEGKHRGQHTASSPTASGTE